MSQNSLVVFKRSVIANSLLFALIFPAYAKDMPHQDDDIEVLKVIGSVAKTGEMRFYDPQSVDSISSFIYYST